MGLSVVRNKPCLIVDIDLMELAVKYFLVCQFPNFIILEYISVNYYQQFNCDLKGILPQSRFPYAQSLGEPSWIYRPSVPSSIQFTPMLRSASAEAHPFLPSVPQSVPLF